MPAPTVAPVTIRNILFATDFSPCSQKALEYAVAEARRHGATLHLLHVLPHEPRLALPMDVVPGVYDEDRREAEFLLCRLENSGAFEGVAHEVLLPTGELWPMLQEALKKHGIDMLVVGTHGRGGVSKLLLGSTAEEIFRLVACPVLTVGPNANINPGTTCRTVVYATDLSHEQEPALAYAIAMTRQPDSRLALVHACAEHSASGSAPSSVLEAAKEKLRSRLPADHRAACEPAVAAAFGPAADVILAVADELKADVIVMEVRRKGTLRESPHLPWSTAHKVVCHAHCPVLTVRS